MVRLSRWLVSFLNIGLLSFSLISGHALAQANDIYRIETEVADQSEAERIAAAKATLGDVILGITGDPAALQHPMVRQAISEAPNYLAKFSYATDANTKTGVKVVLNYSPHAITKLLQQAQLLPTAISTQQGLPLQVNNVQTFTDFKQVQAHLKTVGTIRRAELVSVNKQAMLFNLTLDGDAQLLKTTLAASGKLQAIDGDNAAGILNFNWQSQN